MKWTINHLEDLNKVAAEFLDYVGDKTIFALYGPMGVGKTTFVKAVAACLGVTDDVSCPGQRVSDKKWEIPISF